jgi:hypothetical protein
MASAKAADSSEEIGSGAAGGAGGGGAGSGAGACSPPQAKTSVATIRIQTTRIDFIMKLLGLG